MNNAKSKPSLQFPHDRIVDTIMDDLKTKRVLESKHLLSLGFGVDEVRRRQAPYERFSCGFNKDGSLGTWRSEGVR